MKSIWMLITILLVIIFIPACYGSWMDENTGDDNGAASLTSQAYYTNISVPELQQLLENKDFLLVNTHIPFEGDLPNTDLSIPYDQIGSSLDQLPPNKDSKIVLYCRSDRMSTIASETLAGLGYTNILNLEGGMVAWEKAGLTLEK